MSADGLEPSTHALKGVATPEINNLRLETTGGHDPSPDVMKVAPNKGFRRCSRRPRTHSNTR